MEQPKDRKRNKTIVFIGGGIGLLLCLGVVFMLIISMNYARQAFLQRSNDVLTPLSATAISTQSTQPAPNPVKADAEYRKALDIVNNTKGYGSQDNYRNKMIQALEGANTAIALGPNVGEYYTLRQTIYSQLANLETYAVDRQAIFQLALADAYKSNELGTSTEQYPERIIISDLIDTNQCDLALKETQKLMDKTPHDQSNYGGLLSIQSRAYACLGKLDEAIKSIDDSMFNNKNIEFKQELKAGYLFQAGRDDEALDMIATILVCCPSAGGYRYLWRASIYYSRGQKEAARKEAMIGMGNTWSRSGFVSYMQAQFALDDGNQEEAIRLLQLTEASLAPTDNTFRWKVQKQLADLGAKPILPTPSFSLPEPLSP